MSTLSDALLDIFLWFRVGRTSKEIGMCLYLPHLEAVPRCMRRSDLPPKPDHSVRTIIVSDTHEQHQCIGDLAGDVFIHAGDILMTNSLYSVNTSIERLRNFNAWLSESVHCPYKIVIAGNHDKIIEHLGPEKAQAVLSEAIYLENSSVEVGSLLIYGTPMSSGRSHNKAFQSEEFAQQTVQSLQATSAQRPVHILVTHGPCPELVSVLNDVPPVLHVWGHLHGYHGVWGKSDKLWGRKSKCVNANGSIMNSSYDPHNFPVVVDIPHETNPAAILH